MRNQPCPTSLPALSLLHACALAALLLTAAARADEAAGPSWTFGGFGSLGLAHSDYDQADFNSSALKGNGTGFMKRFSPDVDSRLGAQLGVTFDKKWSGVLQVITEQRYDGSYRPIVEWGNIKYQATPELALRAGRIALPIFLAADYRKIGYAYPWVRGPIEVYGAIPITNSDGLDIAYRWQGAGIKHTTQAFYGRTSIKLTETTGAKARAIAGLTHTAEYGAATLRLSLFQARLNVNIARPLFDGFRQFGPPGEALAERFDVVDKRVSGAAVGFSYDPGKWFLMAEAGDMNGRSFLAHTHSMYASGGYRAGAFTPYLSYSRVRSADPTSDPGLSLAGLPPPYAGAAAQLNAGLDVLLKAIPIQDTVAAGMRWDFRRDMALKLQYERLQPKDGSRGTLSNLQPGFRSGRPVHVTSVVLDFVF
ncbi:MAG: porin [Pseudomonadota bacterium]